MVGKTRRKRRIRNVQVAQTTTVTTKIKILGSVVMLARPGIIGEHVQG
jgi:hypothetical protein